MPCFHPLKGYRGKIPGPSGKRPIVFNVNDGYKDLPVTLPCGQCVGCRLERSRQWAVRCVHEAKQHDQNCFLTLTYDDTNLPDGQSLDPRDITLFLKRLRKRIYPQTVRFFQCGEYGDKTKRPHHHVLLFGYDFPDKKAYSKKAGYTIYMSKLLDDLWGKGLSTIGELNYKTAAYTARYILKKKGGQMADEHYSYETVDPETGEITKRKRVPEYITMSRRPGIGQKYQGKWRTDLYPDDFLIIDGQKHRPPKYYDTQLEKEDPQLHTQVKRERKKNTHLNAWNNTPERLKVREKVQMAKLTWMKREI